MAGGSDSVGNNSKSVDCAENTLCSLDFIENVLECSVCLGILRTPRTLPCLHTFCEECIQGVIMRAGWKDRVSCPVCRKQADLSVHLGTPQDQLAQKLPLNFSIQSMIEGLENRRKVKEEIDVKAQYCLKIETCFNHAQAKLDFYCLDHEVVVCKQCIKNKHLKCSTQKIEAMVGKRGPTDRLAVMDDLKAVKKEFEASICVLKRNVQDVSTEVDQFPTKLHSLEADLRKVVSNIRTNVETNSDEIKSELSKKQEDKIMECRSWLVALETTKADLHMVDTHGTATQRFIAATQMKARLRDFRATSKAIADSLECTKVRMELVELLKCVSQIGEKQLGHIDTIQFKPKQNE